MLAADCFDSVTIYRPSIIVGDSVTGYTTSFHGFYTPLRVAHSLAANRPLGNAGRQQLLGWHGACRGRAKEPGARRVGFGRDDANWSPDRECHGRTYHLTNPQPATVVEMHSRHRRMLVDVALAEPAKRPTSRPRRAPAGEPDFLASFREQMKVYQSYWSDDPEFDSSETEQALPASALSGDHAGGDEPAGALRDRREFWLAARSADRADLPDRSAIERWLPAATSGNRPAATAAG